LARFWAIAANQPDFPGNLPIGNTVALQLDGISLQKLLAGQSEVVGLLQRTSELRRSIPEITERMTNGMTLARCWRRSVSGGGNIKSGSK